MWDGGEFPDPFQNRYERERSPKTINVIRRGIRLIRYQNGNGHLFFAPDTLQDINRALAEYYGEVLPDCPEEAPKKRKTGTAVAADLQFYPTPAKAADELIEFAQIRDGERVLEPSCGDGRLLDAIRRANPSTKALGIEVDPGRAQAARPVSYTHLTLPTIYSV